jgi:hypothetical protein
MSASRVTHILLSAITVLLLLVVLELYQVHLIADARAAEPPPPGTAIYGCVVDDHGVCQWIPVRVSPAGVLLSH